MEDSDQEVIFNQGQGDVVERQVVDDRSDSEQASGSQSESDGDPRQPRQNRRRYKSANRTVLMKPESYTGDGDWEVYLNHFELCAELGKWTSREKALTLAASLRGQAQFYFVTLSAEERCKYDFLVRKLGERFGRARQQPIWMSRLESRQRLPDESIAQLADDIRRITQRAYPYMDHEAQEMLALNQLYKSIKPELRFKCITEQVTSISQAVSLVEMYEGIVEPQRKKPVHMVSNQPGQSDGHKQNKDFSHISTAKQDTDKDMREAINTLQECVKTLTLTCQNTNPRGTSAPDSSRKLCFNCRSPHHLARDCPSRQSFGQRQRQRGGYSSDYRPANRSGNFQPLIREVQGQWRKTDQQQQ